MSKSGQGGKPAGKQYHGGSHQKGANQHGSQGGGGRSASGSTKDSDERLAVGKLKVTDRDRILKIAKALKAKWSDKEYGELALILDGPTAEMPKTRIDIPDAITDRLDELLNRI